MTTPAQEARIDFLLGQMILDEKLGQLTQFASEIFTGPGFQRASDEEMIRKGQMGSMLGVVGASVVNRLQHIAVDESRLHIPLIFGFDVIHGHRTIFPIPLGLAASFDPALIEATSRTAAAEARADGIQWVFSPMVDIARDARWGRIAESAGEDPFLGSELARAYVRGYQGASLLDANSVAACVKHFAAYGAVVAGRDYNTVDMSETQLRQTYLPPYRAAIEAGAPTVMTSFNTLNGIPSSANKTLLTGILRQEWGFNGFTVSDWGAVRELIPHGIAATPAEAASSALEAGTDMDMESGTYREALPDLVRSGRLPIALVDSAVRRILQVKFSLGLFDQPYANASLPKYQSSPADRALARRAAEESFVLLKNDPPNVETAVPLTGAPLSHAPDEQGVLLPLNPASRQKITLIGPLADDSAQMLGPWSAAGDPHDVITLRQALEARLGSGLTYVRGTNIRDTSNAGFDSAVDAARHADIVILALGEDGPTMTGEATSRTRLDLPGNQEQLLEEVAKSGKPIILIVFSGRPLALPWATRHIPVILAAWFPGIEAGPALAATLFGESVPSGKLPAEFPYSVGQEPLYLAQLPTGRPADGIDLSRPPGNEYGDEKSHSRYIDEFNEPVYPFGWGLSYTAFHYSNVRAHATADGKLAVEADVTNSGSRKADEVVQLYFHRKAAPLEQPSRELKGFQRITLAPGEFRHVVFQLTQRDIAFYSAKDLIVGHNGEFDLWVGSSSAAKQEVHASSQAGSFHSR
ncbi:MAG TPA: glycoside hydrolase family 3 N-terminal domain-containing protein [Acidobacteriaceae bacterium]